MSRDYQGYKLLEKQGTAREVVPSSESLAPGSKTTASAEAVDPSQADFDIVQFAASAFFAHEAIGRVLVTAIRIGALAESCSVAYKTLDRSAKAGDNYVQTQGKITFNPKEEIKQIEIPIIADGHFDSTLEFTMEMEDAIGCVLANDLRRCRIIITDDDVFPHDRFRENIKYETLDQVGLSLLASFTRFCIQRTPNVGWRTCMNLLLDQLHNLYYLFGIRMNMYLVDVVFKLEPETEEELLIPGERVQTAFVVALALTVPKALLSLIDYSQLGWLSVAGRVRLNLKANLFRKYLYYSAQSLSKVSGQAFTESISLDIDELVEEGFMVIFKVAQELVKAGVILYFLLKEEPLIALPLLVYPVAMALVLNMRYKTTLELDEHIRHTETAMFSCLRHSIDDLNLIKEYNTRPKVINEFEDKVVGLNAALTAFKKYDFNTVLVMPWITTLAIATFMFFGGIFVVNETLSLGAFLATIAIYKEAGEVFASFYENMKQVYAVIGPLLRVVNLMNMSTDLEFRIKQAEMRHIGVRQQLDATGEGSIGSPTPETSRFDLLHIRLVKASLATDRGGPQYPSLQSIYVSIAQGQLVAILGPHATGKYSLLKLIKGSVMPRYGQVQVPSHLRCVCVPRVPQLYENGNLLQNITFGSTGPCNSERLRGICKRVGLNEHTMDILESQLNEDHASSTKTGEEDVPWYELLSQSELLKMHIIRALYYDAEILLLQRPVDEMESAHAKALFDVLRDYVDQRGLLITKQYKFESRPHTVFFSSGEDSDRAGTAADIADEVWHLSEKGFKTHRGSAPVKVWWCRTDNRIVNSWSREAQHLADDLMQERQNHAATKGILENVKTELADWERETDEAWLPDTSSTKGRLTNLNTIIAGNTKGDEDPQQEIKALHEQLKEFQLETEKLRQQNAFLEQQLKAKEKAVAASQDRPKTDTLKAKGQAAAARLAQSG